MLKTRPATKLTALILAVVLATTWINVFAYENGSGGNGANGAQPADQAGQSYQTEPGQPEPDRAEPGQPGPDSGEPGYDLPYENGYSPVPPVPDVPWVADTPYPGDSAIVGQLMAENGLTEGFAYWQPRGMYLRVVGLQLEQVGLEGILELSGLDYLERLYLRGNNLVGVSLAGLDALEFVDVRFNRFSSLLDVIGFYGIEQENLLYYPQQEFEPEVSPEPEASPTPSPDVSPSPTPDILPELPGQPGTGQPDSGYTPDVPGTPDVTEPDIPAEPDVPYAPDEPDTPDAPYRPELVPDVPIVPEDVLPLRLPAPTGLRVIDGVLSWDAVPNVRAYYVYLDSVFLARVDQQVVGWINLLVEVTSFELGAVYLRDGAVLTVRAVGDGDNFGDSAVSVGFVVGVGYLGGAVSAAGVVKSVPEVIVPAVGVDITDSFTCENFLNFVRSHWQVNKPYPERIYDTDVAGVTNFTANAGNITSLDGIEYFTELTSLQIWNNQLTSLDVSSNTALTSLHVSSNQLTSLDVSYNTALTSLSVSNNQLTSLDVSNNTELTSLHIWNNQLTSLDVSSNTALTSLDVSNNQLTNLDVSSNTALTWLSVGSNNMTTPDNVVGWQSIPGLTLQPEGESGGDFTFFFWPQRGAMPPPRPRPPPAPLTPAQQRAYDLRAAINAAPVGVPTTIAVDELVSLDGTTISTINITGGRIITLRGNGTIEGNGNWSSTVLSANGTETELTLDGITVMRPENSANARALAVNSGSTVILENGLITNSTGVYVCVAGATFIMNGGSIAENSMGVQLCSNAVFTMNGGTIENNTGSGIVSNSSNNTFTMNGGTISGNESSVGGGINFNWGTLTINGGVIENNTARNSGGGIHFQWGNLENVSISPDATIRNNEASTAIALTNEQEIQLVYLEFAPEIIELFDGYNISFGGARTPPSPSPHPPFTGGGSSSGAPGPQPRPPQEREEPDTEDTEINEENVQTETTDVPAAVDMTVMQGTEYARALSGISSSDDAVNAVENVMQDLLDASGGELSAEDLSTLATFADRAVAQAASTA